jgi:hypothetical protein
LISLIGGFDLDMEDVDSKWKELSRQLQTVIEKNPELQEVVKEMRKAKVRGSWESMKGSAKMGEKVIDLRDFMNPD